MYLPHETVTFLFEGFPEYTEWFEKQSRGIKKAACLFFIQTCSFSLFYYQLQQQCGLQQQLHKQISGTLLYTNVTVVSALIPVIFTVSVPVCSGP